MKRSNRLMLVLGVVLALVAFGGVLLFGSGSGTAQPAPTTVSVVTAAVEIPLGTALDSTMVSLVQKPVTEATDTYTDPAAVLGQVVRRTIHATESIKTTDFRASGGTNAAAITAALKPGQVAIAVSVDGLTGVGGFIQEGDYVDVILSQPMIVVLDASKLPGAGTVVAGAPPFLNLTDVTDNTSVKVLVQNVQVLGQGAAAAATTGTGAGAPVDPATGQPLATSGVMILSVTPQQAEIIRYGQTATNATLQLVLRAPGDAAAADATTGGITLRELVDKYGVLPPQANVVTFP